MTSNNLNAIGEACTALLACVLVRSKGDFSKWYLAKSGSYLRSMQSRRRQVPEVVIAMLEWSLQREIMNFSYIPHLGQAYAIKLNAGYACLNQVLASIRQH